MNGFESTEPTPLQSMEQALVLASIASNWPSQSDGACRADSTPQPLLEQTSCIPEAQLCLDDCARSFRLEDCEPLFKLEDCLPDFSIENCAPPSSAEDFSTEPIMSRFIGGSRNLSDLPCPLEANSVSSSNSDEIAPAIFDRDVRKASVTSESSADKAVSQMPGQKIVEFSSRRELLPSQETTDRLQLADRFLDRYTSMLDFIDAEMNNLAVEASTAARRGDLASLSKCRKLTKEFSDMQDELAARASNISALFGAKTAA